MEEYARRLDAVDEQLQTAQVENFRANRELDRLAGESLELKLDAEDLKDEIVIIESSNVEGELGRVGRGSSSSSCSIGAVSYSQAN